MAKRPDFTNDRAGSGKQPGLTVIPPPRMNLNDLDGIRREMQRVYREMRGRLVESQEGYRYVMVLGEMRKMIEACEHGKRLAALERAMEGKIDGND